MLELCTVECTQSYLCTLKAFPPYTNLVVATSAYTRIGKNTRRRLILWQKGGTILRST